MNNLTLVLNSIESGQARTEDLLPLVYDELRRMAGAQMRMSVLVKRCRQLRWYTKYVVLQLGLS